MIRHGSHWDECPPPIVMHSAREIAPELRYEIFYFECDWNVQLVRGFISMCSQDHTNALLPERPCTTMLIYKRGMLLSLMREVYQIKRKWGFNHARSCDEASKVTCSHWDDEMCLIDSTIGFSRCERFAAATSACHSSRLVCVNRMIQIGFYSLDTYLTSMFVSRSWCRISIRLQVSWLPVCYGFCVQLILTDNWMLKRHGISIAHETAIIKCQIFRPQSLKSEYVMRSSGRSLLHV